MPLDIRYSVGTQIAIGLTETSIAVSAGSVSNGSLSLTDIGFFQPFIDTLNMAKTDEFTFRVYERTLNLSTSSVRKVFQTVLSDGQAEMFTVPPLLLGAGWDMTLVATASTSTRTFDWSIRRSS